MAWGKMEKEDLKNLGLDPDAIKLMSDKLTTAASKTDVDELKNSVAQTQNTLKELENTLKALATSRTTDGGGERKEEPKPTTGPQPLQIDPLEFMEDPQASVRKLVNEQIAPVTLHTLNVAADMAYNMAKQQLPYFDKFEKEIKDIWDKYGPAQKGKPGELIENIYNLVKGRHMDEIMTDTAKKEGRYNLVQSGGTSVTGRPGGDGKPSNPEDLLTDKEKEVAARFGLTPKEWAEQKGGLKYV